MEEWNIETWLEGANLHRIVAKAMQRPLVQKGLGEAAALQMVKSLGRREAVAELLRASDVMDGIIDRVWAEVQSLQKAGAATSADIQSKFAGAIEMSYSGLDTFFGGLEGVIGPPNPKLFDGMAGDHCNGRDSESSDESITGNYGIRTTSRAEWHFVVDDDATPM